MTLRLMIAMVATGLLAGCTAGRNYQRPEVTPPSVFRGDAADGADLSSIADLKWFEVFRDRQLQEMIRTALVRNHDLRDAVARVEAARANLGLTRSEQFPTIDGGASATTFRGSS